MKGNTPELLSEPLKGKAGFAGINSITDGSFSLDFWPLFPPKHFHGSTTVMIQIPQNLSPVFM